jgi:hypothetical protein
MSAIGNDGVVSTNRAATGEHIHVAWIWIRFSLVTAVLAALLATLIFASASGYSASADSHGVWLSHTRSIGLLYSKTYDEDVDFFCKESGNIRHSSRLSHYIIRTAFADARADIIRKLIRMIGL